MDQHDFVDLGSAPRRIRISRSGSDGMQRPPGNVIHIELRGKPMIHTDQEVNNNMAAYNRSKTAPLQTSEFTHIPIRIIHQQSPIRSVPQSKPVTSPISQSYNTFEVKSPPIISQTAMATPSPLKMRLANTATNLPKVPQNPTQGVRVYHAQPVRIASSQPFNGQNNLPKKPDFCDFEKRFDRMTAEAKVFAKQNVPCEKLALQRQSSLSADSPDGTLTSSRLSSSPQTSPSALTSPKQLTYKRSGSDTVIKTHAQKENAKQFLGTVLKNLVKPKPQDDTDSGYSGSGSTQAGFTLSQEELKTRIKQFNDKFKEHGTNSQLIQASPEAETFRGNIQVSLCIDKTIHIRQTSKPQTIYHALHRRTPSLSSPDQTVEAVTAEINLPRNTTMGLHITSEDTANSVIRQLLNKFNIADDPKEFALYEQTLDGENEVKLRKIASNEKPILNFLRWNTETNETKRFVLKENNDSTIMWEAFSVPELCNFLRIIEFEEENQKKQVREFYIARKIQMTNRLKELKEQHEASIG